jgi:hypothetical protein
MHGQLTSRRRVLAALGTGVAGLAGCSGSLGSTPATNASTQTEPTRTATPSATVELVASFPAQQNGSDQRRETVLTAGDFASVSEPQSGGGGRPPYVQVTLTDAAAANYTKAMRDYGFTSEAGIDACRYESNPDDPGYCLQTVVDGEVVFAAGMAPSLARTIDSGEFSQQPAFVLQTRNQSQARQIAAVLTTDR